MQRSHELMLALSALTALVGVTLAVTLYTGRARSFLGGAFTRANQPQRFWRYVYSNIAILIFCAAAFLRALLWPEVFQR